MSLDYVELHVHSHYSLLDGLSTPYQLAERAKEIGMNALALTDHGEISGMIDFQNACDELGIQAVLGCEMYIVEDMKEKPKKDDRRHMCVYPTSRQGLTNLFKLMSTSSLEGFHRKPRIDPKAFLENCEDLIITTACLGSFISRDWGKQFFYDAVEKMGKENVFIEIHCNDWDGQREHNSMLFDLHKETGCKMIVANDIHYCRKSDVDVHEMLLCISGMKWNKRNVWSNNDRWKFESKTHFLMDGDEMLNMFVDRKFREIPRKDVIEAITNTRIITDRCKGVRMEQKEINLPLIPQCKKGEESVMFRKLIKDGFERVVLESDWFKALDSDEQVATRKVYSERLTREFKLIESKGFVRYFLIFWELINWCADNGVATGPGRGSVAGSLIAYVIGITRLADPIKHGLLFERFLNEDRQDLPDL